MSSERRGQSTAEYAILIAAVVAAMVGIQNLFKHSVAGGLQRAADSVSQDQYLLGRADGRDGLVFSSVRRETVSTVVVPGEPTKTIVRSEIGEDGCANDDFGSACLEITQRSKAATFVDDVRAPLMDR
ncbi:MAG: hypothetical protein HY597_04270 [Candidatus Omnitrophica bacterium]|nr:hypothetical protein [Candidatus Omnitrophota bacterium]